MENIDRLERALTEFTSAVRLIEWNPPMAVLNFFPLNCCTVASFLLGHILQDRGLGKWHIVNGSSDVGSHDWLESMGIVIDATPHQFDFGVEPFVTLVPSPMEQHFPKSQAIELTRWTQAHRDAYEMLKKHMDAQPLQR